MWHGPERCVKTIHFDKKSPYPANPDARARTNKIESISYWARAQIGPDKAK